MNNAREERNRREGGGASSGHSPTSPEAASFVPLKPRRGLFIAFALALVLLLAAMLTLYFKTVYPYRAAPHIVETDAPTPAAK